MARVLARGKYLFADEDKFYVRGVSYGPFRPNSRGEEYPEPERVAQDFALMRELGANVVRTYVPAPAWMFELAAKSGLRLMVGIPWPLHMAFLDSRTMSRDVRRTIRSAVAATREHRHAIFAYTLGNEIPADIARWHGAGRVSRFLAELYDIGKQLDPEGLFTYANYPSTEYLELGFLDFQCFNVYLHQPDDYRRYLTHLLSVSGDRPLVLSETGMDTIREGETHQAELLGWQSRAAFELGLSGLVVFAFTDEWYRGGCEITDWAFGLVTRERARKQAFSALAAVFNSALPPPLAGTPMVSVVVAAYNASASLASCLASLKRLNYGACEIIVVDDGSSDSTAAIAEAAGVRTIRREHRGLGAARNAGLEAARGELIAFIDADATADRDWLYHLVEAMTRHRAAAAGGPNFPPPASSAAAAALAAAPGAPREVMAGDDRLAQLCGCNMMVDKSRLAALGGFDPTFTGAGDDVDLSWRLSASGATLAYAGGAVVIHERRKTVRAYLAQQRGYGRGEELLRRKYPARRPEVGALYGGARLWPRRLGGGPRIYYGAFGRGLFQTIYPSAADGTLAELPLTFGWVAAAVVLLVAGAFDLPFAALGLVGLLCSLAVATVSAALAGLHSSYRGLPARALLAALFVLGPLTRSFARACERLRLAVVAGVDSTAAPSRIRTKGSLVLNSAASGGPEAAGCDTTVETLRAALMRRGLVVAAGGAFEPYDLEIFLAPALRVTLNALVPERGRVALRWRLRPALAWLLMAPGVMIVLPLLTGQPWPLGAGAAVVLGLMWAAVAVPRLRRLPAVIEAAALEAAAPPALAAGGRAEGRL